MTDKEVEEAVSALRTADPFVVLTPGLIFRYLGKRPVCGECLPLITKLMLAYDENGPTPHAAKVERWSNRKPSRGRQKRS